MRYPKSYRQRGSELILSTALRTQCERLRISLPEEVVSQVLAVFTLQFCNGKWHWKVNKRECLQLQKMKADRKLKFSELKCVLSEVMRFYSSLR